jgi:hypothetical protein
MLMQTHFEQPQRRAWGTPDRRRIHRLPRLPNRLPIQAPVELLQKVIGWRGEHQAVQQSYLCVGRRLHICRGCGQVARLMKQAVLTHRWRRRFRPMSLTDSHHDLPVAPNLLAYRVPTLKSDTLWVADITSVPTDEGWLYVAGVLDRCTHRCPGWAMNDTLAGHPAFGRTGHGSDPTPTAIGTAPSF